MSSKDRFIQLLNDVPEHKMGYVLAYLQGLLADEAADDAFCEALYDAYLNDNDPEKHDTVSLQSFAIDAGNHGQVYKDC